MSPIYGQQAPTSSGTPMFGMPGYRRRRTPLYTATRRPVATPIYGSAGFGKPVARPSHTGVRVRGSGTPTRIRTGQADVAAGDLGVISGYAQKTGLWTEIRERDRDGSLVTLLERVAPGAYRDSIRDKSGIRLLFSHGHDALLGDRPIGTLELLEEDTIGLRYSGRLFNTIGGRELFPLLRAGVLGSSYRFRLDDEDWVDRPPRSAHNPAGVPERTILRATVIEVGPTPFPAQPQATAGVAT